MDWFLYDNGHRHERLKFAEYLKGNLETISLVIVNQSAVFRAYPFFEPS